MRLSVEIDGFTARNRWRCETYLNQYTVLNYFIDSHRLCRLWPYVRIKVIRRCPERRAGRKARTQRRGGRARSPVRLNANGVRDAWSDSASHASPPAAEVCVGACDDATVSRASRSSVSSTNTAETREHAPRSAFPSTRLRPRRAALFFFPRSEKSDDDTFFFPCVFTIYLPSCRRHGRFALRAFSLAAHTFLVLCTLRLGGDWCSTLPLCTESEMQEFNGAERKHHHSQCVASANMSNVCVQRSL